MKRTWLLCAFPALLGSLLAFVRWFQQGSGNIYSRLHDRYYQPNESGQWDFVSDGAPWLGLDAVGGLFALTVGIVVAGWIAKNRNRNGLGRALWIPSVAALLLPIWVFSQGLRPADAVDSPPEISTSSKLAGLVGHLKAPPGKYKIVSNVGGELVATLKAGGETFDARFADEITGYWNGDLSDFSKPMSAEFEISSSSVDTGVGLRNKHAREKLKSEKYPRITFKLERLVASKQIDKNTVEFAASGAISLMGISKTTELTGTVALAIPGKEQPTLWVNAKLEYSLESTPLAEGDTFNEQVVPIRVRLPLGQKRELPKTER